MWMVRAGEGGRFFDDFKNRGIVAIGWKRVGDLSKMQTRDEIRKAVENAYKDEKPGFRVVTAGQLARFRFDFKIEDYVTTYDPQAREYLVGRIKGPYLYDPGQNYAH